ncbi:MAG: DNA-binding protein [Intestinibacter bartlettii]|uniref:DNA-binding protein n=1 Tax=Intestinibacter bartlettii TaxID=261299 RepID=UPI0026EC7B32|nr:DNA-binding protein [Intestinibacter bartlettii]MDO5010388.1 DNA-binding protein [Intestinibacter bartlettii]
MGLFKTKSDENWKINYIKEFNEMRSEYEKKILAKQNEIDELKKQLEKLKSFRSNLRPKEKQIKDSDIESIKELRTQGLSYREISQKTSWSKATVCRVLNGVYD